MTYSLALDERLVNLEIAARRPELEVLVGDARLAVVEAPAGQGEFALLVNGELHRGHRYAAGDHVYVRFGRRTYCIERPREDDASSGGAIGRDELRADMPGVVVAVHCAPGQSVSAGDKLVTLESMKLQVSLVAHRDGVVERVHVTADATFERGAPLVSLAREAAP
jgi:acetyl/propionyl-CoA carboxylase alpha subunit